MINILMMYVVAKGYHSMFGTLNLLFFMFQVHTIWICYQVNEDETWNEINGYLAKQVNMYMIYG